MKNCGRSAVRRGFSIVEAIIALGLVVLAITGLFDVVPFTYGAIGDDSLRAEAATSAHEYLDSVRVAVQNGQPIPGPTVVPLAIGTSMVTGQSTTSTPTATLTASCTQPDGVRTPLFDCTVSISLTNLGETRALAPLETLITRQLP